MEPKLTLIPTPIGNLKDVTENISEHLLNVDLLLCEDTRTTGQLLGHLGVPQENLKSFHAHNEHSKLQEVLSYIKQGKHVGLVSDAGTPAISDPGFLLVRACVQENIEVQCLTGPAAFVPALAVSGLPCDSFYFEGFLPHKKGRKTRLEWIADQDFTIILYESVHRIEKALLQLMEVCGPERQASLSREISKKFESTYRGTLAEVYEALRADTVKGEFVLILAGKNYKPKS